MQLVWLAACCWSMGSAETGWRDMENKEESSYKGWKRSLRRADENHYLPWKQKTWLFDSNARMVLLGGWSFNYSECCCTSAKEEIECEPEASSACTGQSLIQNHLNENSNRPILFYLHILTYMSHFQCMEDRMEWPNGQRCFTRMLLARLAWSLVTCCWSIGAVKTGWRGMEDEERGRRLPHNPGCRERRRLAVAKGSWRWRRKRISCTTGAGGGYRQELPFTAVMSKESDTQTKSKEGPCYSSVSSKSEEGENGTALVYTSSFPPMWNIHSRLSLACNQMREGDSFLPW